MDISINHGENVIIVETSQDEVIYHKTVKKKALDFLCA